MPMPQEIKVVDAARPARSHGVPVRRNTGRDGARICVQDVQPSHLGRPGYLGGNGAHTYPPQGPPWRDIQVQVLVRACHAKQVPLGDVG